MGFLLIRCPFQVYCNFWDVEFHYRAFPRSCNCSKARNFSHDCFGAQLMFPTIVDYLFRGDSYRVCKSVWTKRYGFVSALRHPNTFQEARDDNVSVNYLCCYYICKVKLYTTRRPSTLSIKSRCPLVLKLFKIYRGKENSKRRDTEWNFATFFAAFSF